MLQSWLGQTTLKLVHNFLWTIEKCAEWSLPDQEIVEDKNEEASKKLELVRPLPWILFLPSLVMIRIIRRMVNIGAFVMNYHQVTPSELVKFLQISRTRVNVFINNKMREQQNEDKKSMNEAKRTLIESIRLSLSNLSCLNTSKLTSSPPPIRIRVNSVLDLDVAIDTSEEKSMTESTDNTVKQSLTNESEDDMKTEDEEEDTLKEIIDQITSESSNEDDDFDPFDCNRDENMNEDEENESDNNVSLTELNDIIEDAKTLFNRTVEIKDEIKKFQIVEQAEAQTFDDQGSSVEKSVEVEKCLSQNIDSCSCTSDNLDSDSIFYSPISSDSDTLKTPMIENSLKPNEYANGETHFISASMISDASKTSGDGNNGAIVKKRNSNVSKISQVKYHKGKRTNRRKK